MRKRLKKKLRQFGACVICGRPAMMWHPAKFCMRHWRSWFNGEKIHNRLFKEEDDE